MRVRVRHIVCVCVCVCVCVSRPFCRCESNNLLPFLEDLMGDNTADDMELELEALSLGCLGSAPTIPTSAAHHTMRRIDSLEDIISQSVVAF